ncbi:MAG TPA: DNA adenine methylase [Polyangiaceae bacterium LLY-WYZ-15_(1-7)]|nr:DNA adenine methylase [Polyangiaceae bacterium LLY-WYZ-15_(1-7)]HJL11603.1 DNA adenine methylase [Polyangiaceae bacterium LLY-WYZ-15_(1-7)]HJL20657.1 DNA adenine methylase [Polyangiaceae bacterium LLY-WYZ-15_(1-7)]HJL36166.1 DNA adenine methylase [Polyangiaceae bacterium LLY-WYZ-15_(1-7)]
MKWAGGKGRLLAQLEPLLPPGVERMRHVEPFVGGGALFFARGPQRALLADVNPELINAYRAIRDEPGAVIAALEALAPGHCKERYYQVRERYNAGGQAPLERAALFVYLNKTCFNGLHRVNRKGEFNVPFGRYKNPRIVNAEGIAAASEVLQGADIRCDGFEALVESAKPGDFVYFDPPYEPVSRTSSFTSYARGGFSQEDQRRLRDVYAALDKRGCKLMLSNSDVPFIRELYAGWNVDIVRAARAINSNPNGRGKVAEVVVRNY